jgi:large conductance mechanosensitive channel
MSAFRGFKSFLMQGNLIVIAVGLVIALAFSTLIKAFTDTVITPLVNAAGGGGTTGLGVHVRGQLIDLGAFVSAVIYFVIFVAVVYFAIVVPYRAYQARRGVTVFGEPAATKACPYCLSDDLPAAASKCRHCGSTLDGVVPATDGQRELAATAARGEV